MLFCRFLREITYIAGKRLPTLGFGLGRLHGLYLPMERLQIDTWEHPYFSFFYVFVTAIALVDLLFIVGVTLAACLSSKRFSMA